MLISVVVPVYNVQDYLPRCLDSLYNQDFDDIEIILVNDGSKDDSLAICKKYAQKHGRTIVVDKENGGLSDARNVGTEAASGEYIYYLDSDDWLAPGAIKTLYDFAASNNCEIVQGGFYYAYDDHLLYDNSRKHPQILNRDDAMLELIKNDYVKNFAWGKLYKADIVKKYQFPKGKYYEDAYWQHLIIHDCNRYGIVPTPLYYYRQRESGISGEFSIKNLDLLRGYEERLAFVQKNYPKYTKPMIEIFWNLGFEMVLMSDKKNEDNIRKAYHNYWEKLNREYGELFEKSLSKNIYYQIVQSYSFFIPVYSLFKRVIERIAPSKKYKTIKIG